MSMVLENKKFKFNPRSVHPADLDQLVILENEWPENERASREQLKNRIEKFPQGYFIAEDATGIIGSIISYPYQYHPENLSNFKNWTMVLSKCYQDCVDDSELNALYIISGTTKPSHHSRELFDAGMIYVVNLAKQLGKRYVLSGSMLPGYARYLRESPHTSIADYVFKKTQYRYIDPLIEKYRRHHFYVPDENHIIANYYPHAPSLDYAALVVRDLQKE